MSAPSLLDDSTIEAIVRGDEVGAGWRDLAAFAAQVRAVSERPPSRPSPELARMIAEGVPQLAPVRDLWAREPRHRAPRRRPALARAAGIGLVAKVSLGAAAAAAVAGAGAAAAAVLPGAPGHAVRDAIEVVTPVDFAEREPATTGEPDHARSGGAREPSGAGRPAVDSPSGSPSPDDDHGSDGSGESERDRGEGDDARSPGAVPDGDDADGRGDVVEPPASEEPTSGDPVPPGEGADDGREPPPAAGDAGAPDGPSDADD
jgi:hypothetical protein